MQNIIVIFVLVAIVIISHPFSVRVEAASFNCAKSATFIEKTICSDKQLSEMDDFLMDAYKKALANSKAPAVLKANQRAWLKDKRDSCKTNKCLIEVYSQRLTEFETATNANASSLLDVNNRTITVRGNISSGNLDSSIDSPDGKGIIFLTDSEEGNKIFSICSGGKICEVTGIVDKDDFLISLLKVKNISTQKGFSSEAGIKPFLVIPPVEQTVVDKSNKKKHTIKVTGIIEFGHDGAGGYFWINGGKKKQFVIAYLWNVEDAIQTELNELIESKSRVTVEGVLIGSSEYFDNSESIAVYK